mmetsp:Transcript_7701/g.11060  ORF Transcript_7701/g.11060 Transcript_7701/m.11060 type:complete len:348 (-) Transcript_7701:251-1294(-)
MLLASSSSLVKRSATIQRTLTKRSKLSSRPPCLFVVAATFVTTVLSFHQEVRAYSSFSSRMSPFNMERDGKGTITITPKNEADQTALIVISHGLGDTSEGFADVAEHLARELPYAKIVLPTAPTQPVTMNMGMSMPSWYDITGLDERSNEECKGIEDSQARLAGILEQEHQETGLPFSRMVLGGFSQGGALSLFTGLQLSSAAQKLAGIVLMSAYLPGAQKFQLTSGLEDTPILHCHGTADPLVLFTMAAKSKELVVSKGAQQYEIKSYGGLQHSVNMQEIDDVTQFIKQVLPPDDTCKITVKEPQDMSIKELKAAIRKAGLTAQAKGFMEKSEFIQLVRDHRDGKL